MQRIVIVGTSGSGKTTLAKRLGQSLAIPSYDLDDLHWLPNWQARSAEDFLERVTSLIEQTTWVISGNYSKVREMIWQKADTIIWLDYSFYCCFQRGMWRSLQRAINKQPCCNGNYETLTRIFLSKYSLPLWIIKSYARHRQDYGALFHQVASNKTYLRFHSPKHTEQWFDGINFHAKNLN